ncbi:hypothetical protein GCM10020254_01050 [Streptomyces goshikiensis]
MLQRDDPAGFVSFALRRTEADQVVDQGVDGRGVRAVGRLGQQVAEYARGAAEHVVVLEPGAARRPPVGEPSAGLVGKSDVHTVQPGPVAVVGRGELGHGEGQSGRSGDDPGTGEGCLPRVADRPEQRRVAGAAPPVRLLVRRVAGVAEQQRDPGVPGEQGARRARPQGVGVWGRGGHRRLDVGGVREPGGDHGRGGARLPGEGRGDHRDTSRS